MHSTRLLILICVASTACGASGVEEPAAAAAADPLPTWNEGIAKRTLVEFVGRTTRPGAPDFVPPAERVAVFDNDGTLWGEQPMYVQLAFALDRIKALAPQHPEWMTRQPFKGVLDGDIKAVAASGEDGVMQILAASYTGMTTGEFETAVTAWIESARHPGTGRRYDEMIYQPMLDVLTYLRANGRRPTIAFGNSDGDFEMLEWMTSAKTPRLGVLVHHTDAGREWAYDRDSHIGRLVRGLDEASARGWLVVDMKSDWKVVYPARH